MFRRVLAIDGGGIRGILPARILQGLEELSGQRIYELFDLLVGTSTGGILALGLTRTDPSTGRPREAKDLQSIYVENAQRIFPLGGKPLIRNSGLFGDRAPLPEGATWAERFQHFMGYENIRKVVAPPGGQRNARYSAEGLEQVLLEYFADTAFTQALKPIAITSYDYVSGRPVVFESAVDASVGVDFFMRDIARATSAGPTFFPPLELTLPDGERLLLADGGLSANNPTLIAFLVALRMFGAGPKGLTIVSVGTGLVAPDAPDDITFQLVDESNWFSLASDYLLRAISDGPAKYQENLLDRLLNKDGQQRFWRFQTTLVHAATQWTIRHPPTWRRLCKTPSSSIRQQKPSCASASNSFNAQPAWPRQSSASAELRS